MQAIIRYLFITVITIHFIACKDSKPKRILVDGEYVEGNVISRKDTVYNGLIRFYDTATNQLTGSGWYRNDTLHGEYLLYYPDGKLRFRANYVDGKEHGYSEFYDSTGKLAGKQRHFHDYPGGHHSYYTKGVVTEYKFFSFDNHKLFDISYDSIKGKSPEEWGNRFFFHSMNYITNYPEENDTHLNFFLYIISPPLYDFKYSFCVIDSANNVIKTITEFDPSFSWIMFTVRENEKATDQSFVFKLDIFENGKKLSTIFSEEKY